MRSSYTDTGGCYRTYLWTVVASRGTAGSAAAEGAIQTGFQSRGNIGRLPIQGLVRWSRTRYGPRAKPARETGRGATGPGAPAMVVTLACGLDFFFSFNSKTVRRIGLAGCLGLGLKYGLPRVPHGQSVR